MTAMIEATDVETSIGSDTRIRAAVRTVASTILDARPPGKMWDGLSDKEMENWCTLAHGSSGIALFFTIAGECLNEESFRVAGHRYLDEAIEQIARDQFGESLYCGYSGVALAASIIAELEGRDAGDAFDAIDDALTTKLDRPGWLSYYDMVYGLTGMGIYALQRAKSNPAAMRIMSHIVRHLENLGIERNGGLTLITFPRQVSPLARGPMAISRDNVPNGFYDLGLAHGIPGVICLLSAHYQMTGDRAVATLATRFVDWMRTNRDEASLLPYPSWVTPEGYRQPGKLAWCYGPLGVALALARAGRAFGRDEWMEEAIAVARRCAAASDASLPVADTPYLCHGTSGIAMMFELLGRETGEPSLHDAAWFWRLETLSRIERDTATINGDEDVNLRLYRTGFLAGFAGAALDLASACGASRAWQRVLTVTE